MKRLLMSVLGVLSITAVMAQGSNVLNAYNYMQDGEFLKAAAEIEPATEHPKTSEQGKTWYYRGQIYENIYVRSKRPEEYPEYANADKESLAKAADSYKKAIDLGSNRINMNEVKDRYIKITNPLFQEGVAEFNNKDFARASDYFIKCYNIKKEFEIEDSLAAYNIAIASVRIPNVEQAITYYNICKDIGYQPEKIYPDLAALYRDNGMPEKAEEVLAEGREKMPNNQALITAELNVYLEKKEYNKALENLNLAIQNDQDNKILYYARGTIYNEWFDEIYSDKEKREKALEYYANAERDYKKAIELDAEYFDALYNIGALHFNRGAEMLNEANLIADDAKYKVAKEEATAQLKKALPFLEKAHQVMPSDKSTMLSLRDIYGRINDTEKYDAMNEKLNN